MEKRDHTFSDESLFGSLDWVAATLGRSKDWLHRNMPALQAAGFPKRDPILNVWNKQDVITWVESRRQIHDSVKVEVESDFRENLHAF